MTAVIVGLLICLLLSAAVMAVVAVPARREGREILTAHGERVVVKVRETTDNATTRASGAVTQGPSARRQDGAHSASQTAPSAPPSNRKAS